MANSAQKILFVLTSSATMGTGGKPTGAWLEEFTVPYYFIRDAGLATDVATTAGGAVPFDPRSSGEGSTEIVENRRFDSDIKLKALVKSTPSVEQVRFGNYAAIFLPGGHGTMWDLPNSIALLAASARCSRPASRWRRYVTAQPGLVSATAPDGQAAGRRPLGRRIHHRRGSRRRPEGGGSVSPRRAARLARRSPGQGSPDLCRPRSPTAI